MKKLLIILFLSPLFVFGQTKVKFNQINPTLPANFDLLNNAKRFSVSDSAYVNVPTTLSTPTGSLVILGTSIAAGVGVTGSGVRWTTQVATAMGLTEINKAFSGALVEKRTPVAANFVDSIVNITAYSAGVTRFLIIETGPNDFNITSANYNATNYTTDLTTVINYAISTKGWPASKILVLGNSYIDVVYPTPGFNGTTRTPAIYAGFRNATRTVSNSLGVLYLDVDTWFLQHGGDYNMYDNLHPNNIGHTTEANAVLSVISPATVYRNSQNFASNGNIEFPTVKIDNTTTVADSTSTIVGRGSDGKLGILGSLPLNTRTAGDIYLTGRLFNPNAPYGVLFTPTAQDFVLAQNKIYSVNLNGAYFTSLNPMDNQVGFTFTTNLNTPTNAIARFINGAGTTLTSILQNGTVLATGITFPGNGTYSINAAGGGSTAFIYPFGSVSGGGFGINLAMGYSNGSINFQTSKGVNNTFNDVGRFAVSGNFLLGTIIDDNFNLEVVNKSRFQGGGYFGRLANPVAQAPSTSTSGGTLAAGNYFYKVTALDVFGNETNTDAETTLTTTGSTSSNTVKWLANITGAVSYRIYVGTTTNSENKYFTATAPATSAIDIGSGYTTSVTPSTVNSTSYAGITSTGVLQQGNAQTTVNNSTSGTTVFSEPDQGPSRKTVIIKLTAGLGTASYTFPTPFLTTPSVVGTDDVAAGIVTSKSTTAVTVTGATTTGTLMLIGY